MNRIISLLFAISLLASCGQGPKKSGSDTDREIQPLTVSEFLSDAGPFVDRTVQVSGTVVHVCRHGGQRLFIIGEDGEERIRITTGDDIAEFDVELEGEKIEVTGIVRELIIDETYLAEWEAEITEGGKHDRGEGHEGGVGHGDDHGDGQDLEEGQAEPGDMDETGSQDEDGDHHASGDQKDSGETEDDPGQTAENQLARIQKIRDEIAASGKDHLSDFWIETIELKVIED